MNASLFHNSALQLFGEHHIRIDEMIWIAAENDEAPSATLLNFCDDFPDHDSPIFTDLPELKIWHSPELSKGWPDPLQVAHQLYAAGHLGMIVKLSRPDMHTHENGLSFSWGITRSTYIYAETLADIASKAASWAREIDDALTPPAVTATEQPSERL